MHFISYSLSQSLQERRKVAFAVFQLAACAAGVSCSAKPSVSGSQEEPSVIQSIPGEDSSIPVAFAQGFDHLINEPKRQCVTLDPPSNQPDNENVGGATSVFQMKKIESSQELHESLNISAAGSLQGMWGRASATLKFADSVKMRSSSVYIMVHAKSANQLKISNSPKWAPDVEAELRRAANDPQGNYEKTLKSLCGTRFINGYRTGGEFFAVYEYRFESEDRFTQFSAKVNASNGIWKASTSIDSLKTLLAQNELVNMYILRRGPTGDFPRPEELVDAARGITAHTIDTTANMANQSVTLELIDMGYETVLPIIHPNSELSKKVAINLNLLNKERLDLVDLRNRILDVQKERWNYEVSTAFDGTASDTLRAVDSRINAINDAAIVCIDKPQDCQLPNVPPKPSIDLPRFLRTFQISNSSEYATKTVNWKNQVQMDLDFRIDSSLKYSAEIFPERSGFSGPIVEAVYEFSVINSDGIAVNGGILSPDGQSFAEVLIGAKLGNTKYDECLLQPQRLTSTGWEGCLFAAEDTSISNLIAISPDKKISVSFIINKAGFDWNSSDELIRKMKNRLNTLNYDTTKIEGMQR